MKYTFEQMCKMNEILCKMSTDELIEYSKTCDNKDHVFNYIASRYYESNDLVNSKLWFELSAKEEYDFAQFSLGLMYYKGEGIEVDKKQAFYWFTQAANQGNANAQFSLALMFFNGDEIETDQKQAFYWAEKAAHKGNNDAKKFLVYLYNNGYGVEKDTEKAAYWLDNLIEKSDANTKYCRGLDYYKGNNGVIENKEKALYWFEKAAKQGNASAQCYLGWMYSKGEGTEVDTKHAFYWYKHSANQGCAEAQCNLGLMYYNGKGTEVDLNQAINYFTLAAEQGIVNAQYNLGSIYLTKEEYFDKEKSFYWIKKAADNGFEQAKVTLVIYFSEYADQEMNNDQVNDLFKMLENQLVDFDEKKLMEAISSLNMTNATEEMISKFMQKYFQMSLSDSSSDLNDEIPDKILNIFKSNNVIMSLSQSAVKDNSWFQFSLAYIYFERKTKEDIEKGLDLLEKAANQGLDMAEIMLAEIYLEGEYVEENLEQAIYWFFKAAEHNNPLAQYFLASIFHEDDDPESEKLALYWYTQSAEQGYTQAIYDLAIMYQYGYGTNVDKYKALSLLKKAVDAGYSLAKDDYNELKAELEKELTKSILHISERKDVFVSWNHKDQKVKDYIVNYLNQKQFASSFQKGENEESYQSIWESDGSGTGDIQNVIENAINNSRAYIILLSENSIKSKWVEKEVELILEKVKGNENYKKCICPIIINDIIKDIESIEGESPFKDLLSLSATFINYDKELNLEKIYTKVSEAIDLSLKLDYRNKLISKSDRFATALSENVSLDNVEGGLIEFNVEFEKGYLNRTVYSKDKSYGINELINESNNPILIYGIAGTGKTLYLKNVLRTQFKDDKYFIYLQCKDVNGILSDDYKGDIVNLLREEAFNKYFTKEESSHISETGFRGILESNDNTFILIDALDEINSKEKEKLIESLSYLKIQCPKIHFIFTSRSINDSFIVGKYFSSSVNTYELKGIEDDDIEKIFDSIRTKYKEKDDAIINKVSKEAFMNSIGLLSDDIRKNPMLISNLICIYFTTNELLNKSYEIINKSVDIMINDVEKDRNSKFKYIKELNKKYLNNLLGYISIKRLQNNTQSSTELIEKFIKKNNLFENKDLFEVASEINDYLTRRRILIDGKVSHEIFNDFFAAVYLFNLIYEEKEDDLDTYYDFTEKGLFNLDRAIKTIFSQNDKSDSLVVSSDFLLKLDYEIHNLDKKAIMDEYNPSYNVFDATLTKTLKEKGFNDVSIETIKRLIEKDGFYFKEFIKEYLN